MNTKTFAEVKKAVEDLKKNKKYRDVIFLVRIYDETQSYMSIGDDARKVAEVVGRKILEGFESFTFTHDHLDSYLPMLIKKGYRVAIVDKL